MTRNEIMAMARKAGFPFNKYGALKGDYDGEIDADEMFERFAALVAAAEREHLHKSAEAYKSVLEAAPKPPELTDERIDQLCDAVERERVIFSQSGIYALARAIQREILGGGE